LILLDAWLTNSLIFSHPFWNDNFWVLIIPYFEKEDSTILTNVSLCWSWLTMFSSFLTSLYQLVLWNQCWTLCTSNAIWYFGKKVSSSTNPFKKEGWYLIIGSLLRIFLAVWILWEPPYSCTIPRLMQLFLYKLNHLGTSFSLLIKYKLQGSSQLDVL
jgi:hypothetical protein